MAFVRVNPESANRPVLAPGMCRGKIVSVEVKAQSGDPNKSKLLWHFSLTDSAGQTAAIFSHNSLEPNSGSPNMTWLRQLGIANPESGFDTDLLAGLDVVVEVTSRPDKQNPGQLQNMVKNVVLG